jgi:hypothetical protein
MHRVLFACSASSSSENVRPHVKRLASSFDAQAGFRLPNSGTHSVSGWFYFPAFDET